MTGKKVPGPGGPAESRPAADPLLDGLERVREALHRGLDRIESLAQEQAALVGQDATEREEALRGRVAELEAAQARSQTEARRREQEWESLMRRLDDDRRLLAEAWERLEQEQIEAPTTARGRPTPEATAPVVARQADPVDPDDPITLSILRQFQTLRGDVRRNAGERRER